MQKRYFIIDIGTSRYDGVCERNGEMIIKRIPRKKSLIRFAKQALIRQCNL